MRRNADRFPADFMFVLDADEFANWRCQFGTSNSDRMGLRYAPMAFTEQGVAMLIRIRGSGDIQDYYLALLVEKSVAAASAAVAGMRPAVMWRAAADLSGHSYNRRRILKYGRLSMALKPDAEILREGMSRIAESGKGPAGMMEIFSTSMTGLRPFCAGLSLRSHSFSMGSAEYGGLNSDS